MGEDGGKPIPADALLWRRVPDWHWVGDGSGGLRASSAAFEDDPDNSPMSAAVAAETTILRMLDPVRSQDHAFAVAEFPAAVACAQQQSITRLPPVPEEPAHVFVIGAKRKRVGRALAKSATWAWPPPGRPYPVGEVATQPQATVSTPLRSAPAALPERQDPVDERRSSGAPAGGRAPAPQHATFDGGPEEDVPRSKPATGHAMADNESRPAATQDPDPQHPRRASRAVGVLAIGTAVAFVATAAWWLSR